MLITNEKYESVIKKITLWSWWVCKGTENVLKYVSRAGFAMAGVPCRSNMYRTSAACEIHCILHFAQNSRVYVVHFDEKN